MKIRKSGEGVVWWRVRDTRATCHKLLGKIVSKTETTKNLPAFQDLSGTFKLSFKVTHNL